LRNCRIIEPEADPQLERASDRELLERAFLKIRRESLGNYASGKRRLQDVSDWRRFRLATLRDNSSFVERRSNELDTSSTLATTETT